MKVVVLDVLPPQRLAALRALLPHGFSLEGATASGEASMQALIADADFAIAGQVAVPGTVLCAARKLRLLHKWGVGVDNIDIETARALGIQVARTTGSNALAVAEFTLGLILATLRFIPYGHRWLSEGQWHGPGKLPAETFLLSGKTVGIIGYGAIGSTVARLIRPFGCHLLYTKRTRLLAEEEIAAGIDWASVDMIIETADVICLHCPLTPQTQGLIGEAALARMKPTTILVNVARGGVVDELALAEALRARRIRGAAMDVFSIEPVPPDHPLLACDNAVVTPHLAAVTADTFEPTVRRMFANIAAVARGDSVAAGDIVV